MGIFFLKVISELIFAHFLYFFDKIIKNKNINDYNEYILLSKSKHISKSDNLKDIEDSSKVLILISLNNLSKSQIIYVNNLFKLKRQSELFTAYI